MKSSNFQFYNKFNFSLTGLMGIFLVFTIPSSIIGTAVLNLNIIIFDILLLLYLSLNISNIKFDQKKLVILIFVVFYLLLNYLYSFKPEISLLRVLSIFKIILFIFGAVFIISDKKINNYFLLSIFICTIFVALDSLFQFIFSVDIFGYKKLEELVGGRLSGPFKDELIAGSFLSKLSFLSLFILINNKKKLYALIYLIFLIFVTLLTKERMASLMLIFSTLFYFLIFTDNLKKNFIIFFSSLLIIISFITFNKEINFRFITLTSKQLGFAKDEFHIKELKFFDTQWGAHYLTSFQIFKDNKLIGSGLKTYRYICNLEKYDEIESANRDSRCSSHPHNFYLEVLSEGGILGFVIFIFLIYLFFLSILKIENKDKKALSIAIFLLLFWPIKTTGSIFASWNGFLYSLNIIYILYLTKFPIILKIK